VWAKGAGRSGSKGLPAGWQKFLKEYGYLHSPQALLREALRCEDVSLGVIPLGQALRINRPALVEWFQGSAVLPSADLS